MDSASYDPVTAVVLASGGWSASPDAVSWSAVRQELRLAKAGILYADDVRIASLAILDIVKILGQVGSLADRTNSAQHVELSTVGDALSSILPHEDAQVLADLIAGLECDAFGVLTDLAAGKINGAWAAGYVSPRILPLVGRERVTATADDYARYIKGDGGERALVWLENVIGESGDATMREQYRELHAFLRSERDAENPTLFDGLTRGRSLDVVPSNVRQSCAGRLVAEGAVWSCEVVVLQPGL